MSRYETSNLPLDMTMDRRNNVCSNKIGAVTLFPLCDILEILGDNVEVNVDGTDTFADVILKKDLLFIILF